MYVDPLSKKHSFYTPPLPLERHVTNNRALSGYDGGQVVFVLNRVSCIHPDLTSGIQG